MSDAYYADESVTLWHDDALAVLHDLPDASVNCCVTSPPYFGLRDYSQPGQYGLEASPGEYVETMRALFAEVRRVLADDGTLWLNLGDGYVANSDGYQRGADPRRQRQPLTRSGGVKALPNKSLRQIPARVSLALQDDGWTLRNDIIWHKPNAMPESVTDRLSCDYEHLYLFSKSRFYWFDLDPIREPIVWTEDARRTDLKFGGNKAAGYGTRRHSGNGYAKFTEDADFGNRPADGQQHLGGHPQGRNPGSVWDIPTSPFPAAHFATMPPALAERCVLAGCKPGGTVLDPFSGSGTTGMVATKHGRRYVGIDLSADYLDLSLRTRLAQSGLDFGEVTA